MAKLTHLWYDNFGKNQTPLQRNGMAAIPKTRGQKKRGKKKEILNKAIGQKKNL